MFYINSATGNKKMKATLKNSIKIKYEAGSTVSLYTGKGASYCPLSSINGSLERGGDVEIILRNACISSSAEKALDELLLSGERADKVLSKCIVEEGVIECE